MDNIIKRSRIEDIENRPIDLVIDFNNFFKLSIKAKEIVQCYLKGTATTYIEFGRCNIVKCRAEQFETIETNLDGVDIKDCFFGKCSFNNTKFNNSAIINSNFQSTIFKKCSFKYSSITNTTFDDVCFCNCDLSNLVIEGCRFFNCMFICCKTSNKLIEESLLFNTKFQDMSIDICTIIDNFGISKAYTSSVDIIDRNGYIQLNEKISDDRLQGLLHSNRFSNASKFKIAYYLNSNLLNDGSSYVDKIFDVETWIEPCKNIITFNNTLSLFFEFLSYNYEHGSIMLWPLLKLYNLTCLLSNIPNIEKLPQIYPNIMGIHMAVVKYVEDYYALLHEYTKIHITHPVVLLVCPGPLDCEFYKERLIPILSLDDIKILKVVKHNSPNELFIAINNFKQFLSNISFSQLLQDAANLVTIFSAFLVTRKAPQIGKVKQDIKSKENRTTQEKTISNNRSVTLSVQRREEDSTLTISANLLPDSTIINIICPKQLDLPLNICVKNESRVICTMGNTILDVLS